MKKLNLYVFVKCNNRVKKYHFQSKSRTTLLDALLYVQQLDSSVSVRWNCRTGQCGICAIRVNGKPKLACMTKLLSKDHYLIEPLINNKQIQSLVCDVSDFYRYYFLHSNNLGNNEFERKSIFEKILLRHKS